MLKTTFVIAAATLWVGSAGVVQNGPEPPATICPADWCSSDTQTGAGCVSYNGVSWKKYDGDCTVPVDCQAELTVTIKNESSDNCGCTNLWTNPQQPSEPSGPQDISGQNSSVTVTSTLDVPCGSTQCNGVPIVTMDLIIQVECGDGGGPTGPCKGSISRRLKCDDC